MELAETSVLIIPQKKVKIKYPIKDKIDVITVNRKAPIGNLESNRSPSSKNEIEINSLENNINTFRQILLPVLTLKIGVIPEPEKATSSIETPNKLTTRYCSIPLTKKMNIKVIEIPINKDFLFFMCLYLSN